MVERIYNKSHIQQVIHHTLFIKWELESLNMPTGRPTGRPVNIH